MDLCDVRTKLEDVNNCIIPQYRCATAAQAASTRTRSTQVNISIDAGTSINIDILNQLQLQLQHRPSIHGMAAFSSSEFSLIDNKDAGGGFLWQDPHDEAAPADFFDEFVVLDGADSSTSNAEGSERGAHGGGGGELGRQRATGAAVTPPVVSEMVMVQQQRQMRGTPLADAHHLDMIDMGGLPPNYHDGPGKGSISDSELLKLEGLTMRSPRAQMGPISSSVPPSPTRGTSSRKTGRLGALYVKARDKMATMHGKVRPQLPQLSTAKMEPAKRRAPSRSQFPVSPPLSSAVLDDLPRSSGIELNSATLTDIFGPDITPLHTPLVNGLSGATNGDHPAFWPFTDPSTFTSSSTDSFWVEPSDTMDIDDPNFFTTFSQNNNNRSDFDLPMRRPPQHTSGLMIHMPQPRGPASAVLHPSHQIAMAHPQTSAPAHFHYPPPPPLPNNNSSRRNPDVSPRRHKPRAPSSGARHHHHHGQYPATSPRKPTRSTSSSGSMPPSPSPGPAPWGLHRRSASMQILRPPDGHPDLTHQTQQQSALRKRKSWTTSRRVSDSTSTSNSPRKTLTTRRASSSNLRSADPSPNLGNSGGGGFVNFTPEDHKVLMRGVAPSGSSKTKARRDREAQEQKRKLGEAVRLAVQAAGGDVSKLEEEGIVLGVLEEGERRCWGKEVRGGERRWRGW
ncbi:hypothetical protein B0T16DRAFT_391703 [Cercophora newfieldiana]|uniref:Developmental regulatory protein wetA n=1 Tax=Cercophora newfieldiana TaxID=92897 RepID=A0AA39XZG5_9PEZI|nr:hypothetical protein B0T16DRAFT_391703 [Cercophora newfieldiana]